MSESEQTAEIASALAKAQAVMGPAIINRQNPHFKNRYADLAAVFEAIRKPLADNGLAITQTTEISEGFFMLVTKLRHTSGQWIASEYPLPLNAKPQEIGSALTYARRYSVSALTGVVADEDDDGEATRKTANGNGAAQHFDGEIISPDQIETLKKALAVREIDEKEWLERVGKARKVKIATLADIPADFYQKCLANIQGERD